MLAPGHDLGRPIFLGEIRQGPDRVELGFDVRQIAAPGQLVAMQQLLALPRQQANELGEMQLDTVAIGGKETVGRRQHRVIHHHFPAGRRAGNKRAGARGVAAREIIKPLGGPVHQRLCLCPHLRQQRIIQGAGEDQRPVAGDDVGNLVLRGIRRQAYKLWHRQFLPS